MYCIRRRLSTPCVMRLLTFFFISAFGTVQTCVGGGECLVLPDTAWLQLGESYTGLRPVNTHKF